MLRFFIAVLARSIDSWNSVLFMFKFWMIKAIFPKILALMIAPMVMATVQKYIFQSP